MVQLFFKLVKFWKTYLRNNFLWPCPFAVAVFQSTFCLFSCCCCCCCCRGFFRRRAVQFPRIRASIFQKNIDSRLSSFLLLSLSIFFEEPEPTFCSVRISRSTGWRPGRFVQNISKKVSTFWYFISAKIECDFVVVILFDVFKVDIDGMVVTRCRSRSFDVTWRACMRPGTEKK